MGFAQRSPVAQLVEQVTVNHLVAGSSPARGAIYAPTRTSVGAPFNNRRLRRVARLREQSATCGRCLRVLVSSAGSLMSVAESICDSCERPDRGRNCSPEWRLGREQSGLVNSTEQIRSTTLWAANPLRPTVCAGASSSIEWLGFRRVARRERLLDWQASQGQAWSWARDTQKFTGNFGERQGGEIGLTVQIDP